MKSHTRLVALVAIALTISTSSETQAEILTFDVSVSQSTISLGQSIDWQIFATVSGSTSDNLGIATINANLTDSLGGILTPGTISSNFSDYDILNGGNQSAGALLEIGAFQFSLDALVVEAADGNPLGPLLLASGSFVPSTLGFHTLTATEGSANQFFSPGSATTVTSFSSVNSGFDTFTVTAAVPEPSSMLFLAVGTMLFCGIRYRYCESRPE